MLIPTAPGGFRCMVYDFEVFPNWYCIAVSNGERTKCYSHHRGDLPSMVAKLVSGTVLAGYNSDAYDDLLLRALIANPHMHPSEMFALSKRIITPVDKDAENLNFQMKYSKRPWPYSIDVMALLNGKGSLKEHACRAGEVNVADTPHDFMRDLPESGYSAVEHYCRIDAQNTANRLMALWPLVELRAKLDATFKIGHRIYCLSEQGIAQAVFTKMERDRSGIRAADMREQARTNPDNVRRAWPLLELVDKGITFTTPSFNQVHAAILQGTAKGTNGTLTAWALDVPALPSSLIVPLAGTRFQLGVGGLHSVDDAGQFISDAEYMIVDLDVTSYYPSIIVEMNLSPAQLPHFAQDMRSIRDMRVSAKKAGDKVMADALKIVVNASFGKLNDQYSPMRSIPDAMRVTINGQLFLLMLVEMLYVRGFSILSTNTDGVTLHGGRDRITSELPGIVKAWESQTGLALERADYVRYARRDVNSYVAMTVDGKIKLKGAFQPDTGKGDGLIVKQAAVAFLTRGVSPIDTIQAAMTARDIRPFIYYQRCQNGGSLIHGDTLVGRLARWYVGHSDAPSVAVIRRQNPVGTLAKIPNGANAIMAMELPLTIDQLPNLHFYTTAAVELIESVGPIIPPEAL